MLRDFVRTHACTHAPAGHAASHDIHENSNAYGFPIFYAHMTVMGLRAAALRAAKELRYEVSLM